MTSALFTLGRYVPDREGFERFARTRAFEEYASYTLRAPFDMMSKVRVSYNPNPNPNPTPNPKRLTLSLALTLSLSA